MRLLLDTNAFLWWLYSPRRLGERAHAAIEDPSYVVFVSVVTAWEIAIKLSTGKLNAPRNAAAWLPGELIARRFELLPIRLEHALAVEHLPPHHRDPFDRLLVAQAQVDGLTLVTGDRDLEPYGIALLRCD